MSSIRRLIPAIATVGLTAACGGDDSGTENTGGNVQSPGPNAPAADLANAYCRKVWPCNPAYYAEEYTDIAGCTQYFQTSLQMASVLGADCESAMRAYADCFIRNAQCVPYTYEGETYTEMDAGTACAAQYAQLETACGGGLEGYYY